MRLSPLKVLFIPAWYPSRVSPLSGIFTQRHAEAIKNDVSVFVLYVCADKMLPTQFQFDKSVEKGIPVLRAFFKKGQKRNLIFKITYTIRYIVAMVLGYWKARKNFGKPDLIHVHVLTRSAILPMLLFGLQKIPYVITEHWSRYLPEDNTYKGFLRKRVTELAVKYSKGVACVSNALINGMHRNGLWQAHFRQISNVVDTELFKPTPVEKMDKKCFLHVSSFDPESKNVKGIIDAAYLADQEKMSFLLYLVGDGGHRKELQDYSRSLNFKNVEIIFTGEVYREQLVNYFNLADAFILFSYYENQPCVVLESFACGLPVIGSNAGGIPELVTEDSGILVEPANITALKDAMKRFLDDELSFDRDFIRNKAVANFSYEAVCKKMLQFYQEAELN